MVFIYFSFVQVQDGEGEWRGEIIEFGIHDVYTVVYIILIVEALHVVDIYSRVHCSLRLDEYRAYSSYLFVISMIIEIFMYNEVSC